MAKRPAKARRKTAASTRAQVAAKKKPAPARKATTASAKGRKKAAPGKAAPKRAASKKAPARKTVVRKAAAKKTAPKKASAKKAATRQAPRKAASTRSAAPKKLARRSAPKGRASSIDSRRRELEEMVPSPPSSLNMNRRGSAARTGRDEMAEHRADHATMTPSITGGDVDADVEDAYFTGDEAPGGDNPTPDQDIVDEIGKALGVEYQDNEELQGANKLEERDKHRWELDPASAEDYRDRDRE
ncbi:MAG: DUF6335 family protein [Vicinamibacterales bacterium]